jgi:hypothetical protein
MWKTQKKRFSTGEKNKVYVTQCFSSSVPKASNVFLHLLHIYSTLIGLADIPIEIRNIDQLLYSGTSETS